jgi:hypothetical protein
VVPTRASVQVLLSVAACLGPAAAAADEATESALLQLRKAGVVSCQPVLPYFCENMHVRCSGRTSVAISPFTLRVAGGTGSLELAPVAEDVQRLYANAAVDWSKDDDYVLLSPRGSNGYLKLLSDGRFVFRYYIQSVGVMSLGSCK